MKKWSNIIKKTFSRFMDSLILKSITQQIVGFDCLGWIICFSSYHKSV